MKRRPLSKLAFVVLALCTGALSRGADFTAEQVRERLVRTERSNPIDFAGKDLSDLDLSNIDFGRADLSGANLFGARLVSSNLAEAKLVKSTLNGAWVMGDVLRRGSFGQQHAESGDPRRVGKRKAEFCRGQSDRRADDRRAGRC